MCKMGAVKTEKAISELQAGRQGFTHQARIARCRNVPWTQEWGRGRRREKRFLLPALRMPGENGARRGGAGDGRGPAAGVPFRAGHRLPVTTGRRNLHRAAVLTRCKDESGEFSNGRGKPGSWKDICPSTGTRG